MSKWKRGTPKYCKKCHHTKTYHKKITKTVNYSITRSTGECLWDDCTCEKFEESEITL